MLKDYAGNKPLRGGHELIEHIYHQFRHDSSKALQTIALESSGICFSPHIESPVPNLAGT